MTARRPRPLGLLLLLGGALVFFGSREPPAPIRPPGDGAIRSVHRAPPGPPPPGAPADVLAQEPEVASSPPTRGPVRVRVLGPGGEPLAGVFVAARAARTKALVGPATATDEAGEALLPDVPWDGSRALHVYRRDPDRGGAFVFERLDAWGRADNVEPIEGPEILYRAATGLRLTVRAVNAETGLEVEGARVLAAPAWGPPRARWQVVEGSFVTSPAIGKPAPLDWRVEAPRRFVVFETPWREATISPYARELVAFAPLRHEVAVTLLPRGPDGAPVPVEVLDLLVAGRTPDWTFRSAGAGRVLVGGVPFLREEIVDVGLCRLDGTGPTRTWAPIPEHPGAGLELPVTVPAEGRAPEEGGAGPIGFTGSATASASVRMRTRPDPGVPFVVAVKRQDGAPAVGATVRVGSREGVTDLEGLALLQDVPPGPQDVEVRQVGLRRIRGRGHVPLDGTGRVDLVEEEGGSLEVLVVDGERRPLSFASLSLVLPSGLPFTDVQEGIQRIDPFTDHLGRRVLDGLEAGEVEIAARWGSRAGSEVVTIVGGEVARVTLVLERPAAPVR